MCGGEGSVRIEPADNGYIVHAYTPGKGDKPGRHHDLVASDHGHAMRLAAPHVKSMKKRGGHDKLTVEGAHLGSKGKPTSKRGRKKHPRKRA